MKKGTIGLAVLFLSAAYAAHGQVTGPDGRPIVPGQFQNPPAGPVSPPPGSPEDVEQRRQQEEFTRWRHENWNHDINLISLLRQNSAESEDKNIQKDPPRKFYLGVPRGPNPSQWECSNPLDFEAICGDDDGCTVDVNLQYLSGTDVTRTNVYKIVMERRGVSKDHSAGISGYTRALGWEKWDRTKGPINFEYAWATGAGRAEHIFSAFGNAAFMLNFFHKYCTRDGLPSAPFKHPYHFSFAVSAGVAATFIVYD